MPVHPKEQELGRKAFNHELKTRGVDGFINWQDQKTAEKARSKERALDSWVDKQAKDMVFSGTIKIGYAGCKNWPFPEKEIPHGR